ncbi:unnamed protein product, partial [Brenthis ino]
MCSRPIPATAANLIETSRLQKHVHSHSCHSHTPVGRHSTRPLRRRTDAKRALLGTEVKHRQLPNSGLLLKDAITILGQTRDSTPGSPDV